MINCNSCGFHVNGNLKHSINTNQCPSCGANLMDNDILKKVNSISAELSLNGFDYPKSELKLLAIFISNKYLSKSRFDNNVPLETAEENIEDIVDNPDDLQDIRNQISQEYEDKLDLYEEPEERVARLQRLAKESKILNKRGASVRRISDHD